MGKKQHLQILFITWLCILAITTILSMSISSNFKVPASTACLSPAVISQIFSLFSDARLKSRILVPLLQPSQVRLFFFNLREPITIAFSDDFPRSPPHIFFEVTNLYPFLLQSTTLDSWGEGSSLSNVIAEILVNITNFLESQESFGKNKRQYPAEEQAPRDQKQSSEDIKKGKVMMNGCADNELTQTKNLNRHFRSKLRDVYFDLVKKSEGVPEDAKWIEASFTMSRVGFEDIARVLKNQWFSKEVAKQMQNGRFMHKIMKGMMSIKSKKLMVKYYHVMLAASKDPENFVKWKYQ